MYDSAPKTCGIRLFEEVILSCPSRQPADDASRARGKWRAAILARCFELPGGCKFSVRGQAFKLSRLQFEDKEYVRLSKKYITN